MKSNWIDKVLRLCMALNWVQKVQESNWRELTIRPATCYIKKSFCKRKQLRILPEFWKWKKQNKKTKKKETKRKKPWYLSNVLDIHWYSVLLSSLKSCPIRRCEVYLAWLASISVQDHIQLSPRVSHFSQTEQNYKTRDKKFTWEPNSMAGEKNTILQKLPSLLSL